VGGGGEREGRGRERESDRGVRREKERERERGTERDGFASREGSGESFQDRRVSQGSWMEEGQKEGQGRAAARGQQEEAVPCGAVRPCLQPDSQRHWCQWGGFVQRGREGLDRQGGSWVHPLVSVFFTAQGPTSPLQAFHPGRRPSASQCWRLPTPAATTEHRLSGVPPGRTSAGDASEAATPTHEPPPWYMAHGG